MRRLVAVLIAGVLTCATVHAQKPEAERPTGGVVDFLLPIEPDPIVQHSKEVYVRNGCGYCHGIDLKVRNGEAADLMHSAVVAGDVDGNVLGPLLQHGIPQTAKLSPMPQFSDLSDRNIKDLARWIHYARQQGRFADLTAPNQPAGDAHPGEAYVAKNCATCHTEAAMVKVAKSGTAADLRARMLKPATLNGVQSFKLADMHDTTMLAARQQHGHWLETVSPQDAADVAAYLSSLR
jgi:mono/diheme cytochrome c family protein